jgi:hypothetical protein
MYLDIGERIIKHQDNYVVLREFHGNELEEIKIIE